MNLEEIVQALELKFLTEPSDLSTIHPKEGYASDLLSCVLAGAKNHSIWITLQAHANIVAVAALMELSAVIISENAQPDIATINKANQEKVILLSTPLPTFQIAGKLWELGIR